MLSKNKAILLAFICVLLPANAYATQQHADPEGLYSHLIAHIFFIVTMALLYIQIRKSKPTQKGWRFIGIAAILFILWNINTFTVHVIRESITSDMFTGSAMMWDQYVDVSSIRGKLFYAGKILDHVFLVSAVWAFLLGIKSFYKETEPVE